MSRVASTRWPAKGPGFGPIGGLFAPLQFVVDRHNRVEPVDKSPKLEKEGHTHPRAQPLLAF